MAHAALVALLRSLRRLSDTSYVTEATDSHLLWCYITRGEEAAFEALLHRHAALVWGVCRRLLGDEHDAEDAFQAAFLVLVRKAGSLRTRESLANWLHAVAYRVALKARVTAMRRRLYEAQAQPPASSDPLAVVEGRDLRLVLDEELDRLPEKYRAPLVLCYLEGKTYAEAARQLGWKDGTVCSRLARARELLRCRLLRRGLTLSGMVLAEPMGAPATSLAAVLRTAALFALGESAAGTVSTSVATLAQDIVRTMAVGKLKAVAAVVLAGSVFAAGMGWAAHQALLQKPAETARAEQAKPAINKVDTPKPGPDDRSPRYPAGYTQSPAEIGGKSFDDWVQDLSHPDPSVRVEAVMVMPLFRLRGEDAIRKLARMAQNDGDASPRAKAVLVLGVMGVKSADREAVVRALGHCVAHDPQTIIRYEAARALPRFGTDARIVITDLVMGMAIQSTFEVREACIMALRAAGVDPTKGPDPRVTDALIARLNPATEPTRKVRLQAIMALGGMGRPQDPNKYTQVMNQLKGPFTFKSRDKVVKLWSHVAIMALDDKVDESYLKTIVGYMSDREREVRVNAVRAMGALGVKAHQNVGDVIRLLDDKDIQVKLATIEALGRMGDRGEKVLDALIKATELEGSAKDALPVVMAACTALVYVGVASPQVIAALDKASHRKDLDEPQRFMILKMIEEIKKPKEDVKLRDQNKEPAKKDVKDVNRKPGGR